MATAGNLAGTLSAIGEHQAARTLAEDTLARYRQLFGDDHPDTLNLVTALAAVITELGDHDLTQNFKHEQPPPC